MQSKALYNYDDAAAYSDGIRYHIFRTGISIFNSGIDTEIDYGNHNSRLCDNYLSDFADWWYSTVLSWNHG